MLPERYNFSVWRGTTFRTIIKVKVGDEYRDFTSCTANFVIHTDNETEVELTTENDGVTIDETEIHLFLSDEATRIAAWRNGTYEFFVTDASGDTEALFYGNFSIRGLQ